MIEVQQIYATKTLKAFVKNTAGVNSVIRTETYTFGTPPTFKVYFKKPTYKFRITQLKKCAMWFCYLVFMVWFDLLSY